MLGDTSRTVPGIMLPSWMPSISARGGVMRIRTFTAKGTNMQVKYPGRESLGDPVVVEGT